MTKLQEESVPLNERRLLSLSDFCIYSSMSKDRARVFISEENLMVKFGPRSIFVDRKKFDDWCDKHTGDEIVLPPSTSTSVFAQRRRRINYGKA